MKATGLLLACILLSGCQAARDSTGLVVSTNASPVSGATVSITSDGFSPNPVKILKGQAVTWVNRDSHIHWVSSDPHPSNDYYPDKGGCRGSSFDSCRGLVQGEGWTFTFNENGTWPYHDHLNNGPPYRGTVIVE